MESTRTEGHILQQGHLDGLCLLYAILNGYKALDPKRNEQTAREFAAFIHPVWDRMIAHTPSLHKFLSLGSDFRVESDYQKNGSKHAYVDEIDVEIKRSLLGRYATLFGIGSPRVGKFHLEPLEITGRLDAWQSALVSGGFPGNQVYLVCVTEKGSEALFEHKLSGEHWLPIVGVAEDKLAVACSYSGLAHPSIEEKTTIAPDKKRYFNNLIVSKLNGEYINTKSIYKMTLEHL